MKGKLLGIPIPVIAVILVVLVFAGVVFASQLFTKNIGGTVNVVALGDISVSPMSLDFGDVNRGQTISREFTITNISDGDLNIYADDTIMATLGGYSTNFTLCSVDHSAIDGLLVKDASITDNITFTISSTALAGESTFTFTITGATLTE